tara:strand:+ start:539 stop:1336 length:798 start_codon:yes stop_codon:yes gene_type:complete
MKITKSKVISKKVREQLSVVLTTFAIKDELTALLAKYNDLSDTMTELHNKICDDIEGLPSLAKQFMWVETTTKFDGEDTTELDAYSHRCVYNAVNPFYHEKSKWGQLNFDNTIEQLAHTIEFNFDIEDRSLLEETVPYNDFWSVSRQMSQARVKSNRKLCLTNKYGKPHLPTEYYSQLPVEKAVELSNAKDALKHAMENMETDIRTNIEGAKTTKNLVHAWPEAEPFVAKMFPECTDTGVQSTCETPLGNIILRHVKALPALAAE